MCDLVEFMTRPDQKDIVHKIISDGIVFYIKGNGKASVGLKEIKKGPTKYSVKINEEECEILVNNCLSYDNDNLSYLGILSNSEYRKFWITWKNGCVKFGKGDSKNSLLSAPINNGQTLKFVTFSTDNMSDHDTHWKCYLPPPIERPILRKVQGDKPYWVQMEDQLPEGATIGGHENELLYIMRSYHKLSLTPGKFVPSQGKGFVAWGEAMHEKNSFEILCGYDFIWVPTSKDLIPLGAVEGGYTEGDHEIMYVGRAMHEGHLIPGKVAPSHKVCYIPYQGKCIAKDKYDILIEPFHKIRKVAIVSNFHRPTSNQSDNDSDILDYEDYDDHVSCEFWGDSSF